MTYQVIADVLARDTIDVAADVGDAELNDDVHHDGDVAETGVHVDDGDGAVARPAEGGREVRRDRGFADAALGPEHRNDGAAGRRRGGVAAEASAPALFLLEDRVDG